MILIVRISTPAMGMHPSFSPVNSHPFAPQHLMARRLFSQPFNPFATPLAPRLTFRRSFVNYTPFVPYSPVADFCSLLMQHHQRNFFPTFNDFSPSYPRPTARQFHPQPSEAEVRRHYGISDTEDLYSGVVQRTNDNRHQQALQKNTDGAGYLKSVINGHLQALPQNEKDAFKKKIEESDPEIFLEIPRLAVKKAISSATALTKSNTPGFMHKHLDQLEQLRQKQSKLAPNDLWKECCDIATHLSREADCIASMQKALESVSNT
jgi:hypothetical protein